MVSQLKLMMIVMQLVTKNDRSIEYAEERRLFYVAMTRTKNRVYIVTPEQRPSEFILELINDYPDVTVNGNINYDSLTNIWTMKKCPVCSYPLQLRWNKNYGLKLWICTNEPEICDFLTNDITGGDLSIKKCDSCKDGYLIVKKSKGGGSFLGCTNYKNDNTGCNRMVGRDEYSKWLNAGFEMDYSIDKPSYMKETKNAIPDIKSKKLRSLQGEKKKNKVHSINYQKQLIEKDGFSIIVDNDGQIITDMNLLSYLRELRLQIAKATNKPAYTIVSNKGLVGLATYRPASKEEFINIYGLGERTYQFIGNRFINAIKEFYKNDHIKKSIDVENTKQKSGEEESSNMQSLNVKRVGYPEQVVEMGGFSVIVDNVGKIKTNMELLSNLQKVRRKIAEEKNKPVYMIVSNKGLVSLATYMPVTKEEFVKLYGLGEATYKSFGNKFINIIKQFKK